MVLVPLLSTCTAHVPSRLSTAKRYWASSFVSLGVEGGYHGPQLDSGSQGLWVDVRDVWDPPEHSQQKPLIPPLPSRQSQQLALYPFPYLSGRVPPSVMPFTLQLALGVHLVRVLG